MRCFLLKKGELYQKSNYIWLLFEKNVHSDGPTRTTLY